MSDTYFTAIRTLTEIGRYGDALDLVAEGVARIDSLGGPSVSATSWSAFSHCVRGEWDEALAVMDRAYELLGDRAADPPAAAAVAYGVAAYIHAARGNTSRAEDYLRIIRPAGARDPRFPSTAWAAWALLRLGRMDDARAELALLEPFRMNWGYWLAARCELAGEEGAWDEAEGLVKRAREHADASGLLALPAYADRLEGRAALARGDEETGITALRRSAETFAALTARWEWACSVLDLAAVGVVDALPEAQRVLERAGSVRELERAAALDEARGVSR